MNVHNELDQFELKLIQFVTFKFDKFNFALKWDNFAKIGHVVQIVVHQFVPKTSDEKKSV